MSPGYNAFGPYLRERFGTIVYKVNVDAGFTCPNRDGTVGVSGCIYCNNDSFRPSECKAEKTITEQVRKGIEYLSARYKAKKFLVYFQPYSNTYAPLRELEHMYAEALSVPSVIGLAIGTRPDCVDEDKIRMLQELAINRFILIEYGVQSIYDKSLKYILRGHDYQAFLDAVYLTAHRGIHIGAHTIMGFPTETRYEMLAMADELSNLPIGFLKIHQLQVIKNTILAKRYEENPFPVFGYDEYLDFLVEFMERLSPEIVLQRLFAMAPDDILIAPRWDKTRQEIISDIKKRFEKRNAVQGSHCLCCRK
ncbi:MAG TPA: TIGR01212 family radical SAM protein [Thermodesulfovibrionales bacterium]|nr:TIGR01212 family radical SAM protein [Thermodesulfovibrionales bacterium]